MHSRRMPARKDPDRIGDEAASAVAERSKTLVKDSAPDDDSTPASLIEHASLVIDDAWAVTSKADAEMLVLFERYLKARIRDKQSYAVGSAAN